MFLTSCTKQPLPTQQLPSVIPTGTNTANTVSKWGEFVVIGAQMFVNDIYERNYVYNYTAAKTSMLLASNASNLAIDSVQVGVTTYSFYQPISVPGTGNFVLNGDTSKHYLIQYTGQNMSIIDNPNNTVLLMGGSARPLMDAETVSYANQTISLKIDDATNDTCEYVTVLTFKKIKSW